MGLLLVEKVFEGPSPPQQKSMYLRVSLPIQKQATLLSHFWKAKFGDFFFSFWLLSLFRKRLEEEQAAISKENKTNFLPINDSKDGKDSEANDRRVSESREASGITELPRT